MKNVIIAGLAVTTVLSLAGNALLYQRYSTNRPLVRVGGDVITKKQYQDAVDYQTQGAILKKMVFASLVRQAAARQSVMPIDKDVNARIALIERTKPGMLQAANQDPAKMAELRDNLKTDIALDNLRSQGIKVNDADVADFYARNKQLFALPSQVHTTLIVAENGVDASTAVSLLKQGTPLDVIARQPRLHIAGLNGYQPNFNSLPPDDVKRLSGQVSVMKVGEVNTIKVGPLFLVVQATQNASAGIQPLSKIKPQVTEYAKLKKAPGAAQEIARLYKDAHVSFEMDKYAAYFSDVQDAASQISADKKIAKN